MGTDSFSFPAGLTPLRKLSLSSPIFLCRENATSRLLVLKFAKNNQQKSLKQEALALHALSHFPLIPRLALAIENEKGMELIMREYFGGEPLIAAMQKYSTEELLDLFKELDRNLHSLHREWLWVHGDLSPKNILVLKSHAKEAWQIRFIDWEFSTHIQKEDLRTHEAFRGTVGFASSTEKQNLFERDFAALRACFSKLSLPHKKKEKNRWLLPWN